MCHTSIKPEYFGHQLITTDHMRGPFTQVVYQCTKNDCKKLFLSDYVAEREHPIGYTHRLILIGSSPSKPKVDKVPSEITQISDQYAEIFKQSAEAESHNLNQVAGIGYRKALEFLVKDYLISEEPEKKADIETQQLSRVINNYVKSTNIKSCAERATWLGNDEAHYLRKWENHDIEDLKRLLQLTENWIVTELQTKQYLEELKK
jgi:hypothetical protein